MQFSKWPYFAEDELQAVTQVLRSGNVNYWTGTEVKEFEQEFSSYFGIKHAIAVTNGSVALELALRGLNIGLDDDVLVTCRSFIASASCIVLVGARPVFVNIDRDSQNVTVETLKKQVTPNTKAIVLVHLAGWPCDMDPILHWAREEKLYIIEDCAQAHGAQYKERYVGSIGDVAAWSFCQDKIMTTGGEGGMVTTNNKNLYKKMWSYKDHGKDYQVVFEHQIKPSLYTSLGTNWRMTEMQAAIGRKVLPKLAKWLQLRRRNTGILAHKLQNLPFLRIPLPPDEYKHAYYKFYIFLDPSKKMYRDVIIQSLKEKGVPCDIGSYSELYKEEGFRRLGFFPEKPFDVALELGETSIMFAVHPTLSRDEMEKLTDITYSVLSGYLR